MDLMRLVLNRKDAQYCMLGTYWIGYKRTPLKIMSFFNPTAQLWTGQFGVVLSELIVRLFQELPKKKLDQHLLLELPFNALEVYGRAVEHGLWWS